MSTAIFIRLHDRSGRPEFINVQYIEKFWPQPGGCLVLMSGASSGDFYEEGANEVLAKIIEAKGDAK